MILLYHFDDQPRYDSDIYYDPHPTFGDYLVSLPEPCVDPDCERPHVVVERRAAW